MKYFVLNSLYKVVVNGVKLNKLYKIVLLCSQDWPIMSPLGEALSLLKDSMKSDQQANAT